MLVLGSKVVAPRADAVGLVDRDEREQIAARERGERSAQPRVGRRLGSRVEQVEARRRTAQQLEREWRHREANPSSNGCVVGQTTTIGRDLKYRRFETNISIYYLIIY